MSRKIQTIQLGETVCLFYKLATDSKQETSKERYKRQLKAALSTGEVLYFIKDYENTGLITPQDLKALVDAYVDRNSSLGVNSLKRKFNDILETLRDYRLSNLREAILPRLIEKKLEGKYTLTISDYITIEQYAWPSLSPEMRTRIHQRLMLDLLNLIKKIRFTENEEILQDDREQYVEQLKHMLSELISKAHYFPRTLAEALIKRVGDPELYSDFIVNYLNPNRQDRAPTSGYPKEYAPPPKPERPEDQLTHPNYQKKLSVFDVATWYKAYGSEGPIKAADFIHLLSRCDEGARQYLRGFLYSTSPTLFDNQYQYKARPSDSFFMLGEDMHPMNEEYAAIEWPPQFYILKLGDYSAHNTRTGNGDMWYDQENKEKWEKIFHDFKIIPH